MPLSEKVVLVTGGNSGIGRGIALRAATEGARVAITGRDPDKGQHVLVELAALGADALFIAADLGHEAQAAQVIEQVVHRFGGIDIVINNAGAGTRRSSIEVSDGPAERLKKLMHSNLHAAYHVGAYALPVLKARGGGSIVNISSTAALHGTWGNYGIAKAAVEALTRSLAVQGAPFGIRANGISPGWIATEVTAGHPEVARAASLLSRMGTPDEIARAALFLASDDASFITGQTLIVDGGMTITDYPSQPWLDAVGAWKLFPDLP